MKVLNPSEAHPPMGAAAITISDKRMFTRHLTRRVVNFLCSEARRPVRE
jgi:hypothetical protein